jgi:hypothetical protein
LADAVGRDGQALGLEGLGERGGAGGGLLKHHKQQPDQVHGLHAGRQTGPVLGRRSWSFGRRRLPRGLLLLAPGGVSRGINGRPAQREPPDFSAAEEEAEVVVYTSAQPLPEFLHRASFRGLLDKRPDGA